MLGFLINRDVRAVMKSMRDEPSAWSDGGYWIRHPRGLSVWAANQPYGVEIARENGGRIWGGVSLLSSIGLSLSHWALCFAIRRFRGAGQAASILAGERQ